MTRRFVPGGGVDATGTTRTERMLSRILGLSEVEVVATLDLVHRRFAHRHRDLRGVFEANFAPVIGQVEGAGDLSPERLSLIGAYFTHEYAVEAAALSNPSIVEAPNQAGLAPGATRFILSLRAIGEGHISSIEFREGVIDADGEVTVEPAGRYASTTIHVAPTFEKTLFVHKLNEIHACNDVAAAVLERLPERFSLTQLESAIGAIRLEQDGGADALRATRPLHWLASSNYESTFSDKSALSERVLFPAVPTESSGMEDARFVRFVEDDGAVVYFATYTAYDGYEILPQLIETTDFLKFGMSTLNGEAVLNKGMALFPRKVDGRYLALSRPDNENNFLMWSDNVRFWHESTEIQRPKHAWELVQLGNCGSPLETEAGWLVITHGVGPMRQYALGAVLLDLADPARVIGHLPVPLLEPTPEEREGYVPNVVYSCGSMVAGGHLVLPYGFSDTGTRFATVPIDDLLTELQASERR